MYTITIGVNLISISIVVMVAVFFVGGGRARDEGYVEHLIIVT